MNVRSVQNQYQSQASMPTTDQRIDGPVQFIYRDLGQRRRGDIVEFKLNGSQANIGLLDSSNYNAFKNGGDFRGVVPLATGSPVRLSIPSTGRWYGVIYIPPGYGGQVRGSIGVTAVPDLPPRVGPSHAIPSPLNSIRDAAA